MDIEKTIREYLPGVIHMSLATCADGKPWVCEVHYSYDEDLNIYFRSMPSRRHSQEIAANPNVAGNIVEQHGMTDKPRGVYFEGAAELLTEVDENHIAYKVCNERFGLGPKLLEEAAKEDGHKFYKITVSDFYLFDSRESRPSQKYHLPWGSKS
jgi:uncharacterized protein YhbP (UPF0306 family)